MKKSKKFCDCREETDDIGDEPEPKEWKIKSPFMKSLFVMGAAWGVIQTILFILGMFIGVLDALL